MCGIVGLWDLRGRLAQGASEGVVSRMLETIVHRGPDDSGIYSASETGLALGHRRLSIVDLSPLGHQPMSSESGRYVIVYNGEVYNHDELRRELQACGAVFRGPRSRATGPACTGA